MIYDWLHIIVGIAVLVMGGHWIVKGAVNLSLRLGISPLVVSLTVVAFGTSAPELLIAIQAVLERAPGIALGNVVGSNTANILLVLGLPALLATLDPAFRESRPCYGWMVVASLLFIALAHSGRFMWVEGIILLGALVLFLGSQFRQERAARRSRDIADEDASLEEADPHMSRWRIGLFVLAGILALPLGADLLVDGAEDIAGSMGMSEAVIGLTIVALGTSLPELTTTIVAAFRRQAAVAIGNAIGSNVFNLLAIIGIASFFGPIPVPGRFLVFDLWVMLGATLLLAPFVVFNWRMGRIAGASFSALYIVYVLGVLK